jgi:glycosyltransferase involved in cell wall biosynthesis
MNRRSIRLVHIITGLDAGGAEAMLAKLLRGMNKELFSNEVISLTNIGLIGKELRDSGFKVTSLGMRRGLPSPLGVLKLFFLLGKSSPDLALTWMYHADLIGGTVARLCGIDKLCWNVRHCNLDADKNKFLTILTAKTCAAFSAFVPSRIVCNSRAGLGAHQDFGYMAKKLSVIPNGFDTEKFFPDEKTRKKTRKSLGVDDDQFVFGNVGRYNLQKNHSDLLDAFALVLKDNPRSILVCCGRDVSLENHQIKEQVERLNLHSNVLFLGFRKDVTELLNSFDTYVSSSLGEGFSNSIGEAMAVGIPCVVTDVGDSKDLVGQTGWTVDSGCHFKLAEGMSAALLTSMSELSKKGSSARRRIVEVFSIQSVISSFEQFYLKLIYE